MLKELIIWTLIIGIAYRIITRFILPIFRVTSAASSHVRQMQDQMKEMNRRMNENQAPKPAAHNIKKEGDYIEYEEVR